MTKAPCKNCADRRIGCHGVCESYYNFTIKHEQEMKKIKRDIPPKISNGSFLGSRVPKPKHKCV